MKVSDYIVDFLIKNGCRDIFGIPGSCVLELLYAAKRHENSMSAHLNYHEQCSGFAAIGYAQAGGNIGVAYATKGPGLTNLITPIADAYADSIPSFFFTAHNFPFNDNLLRYQHDQELDSMHMFSKITKYVVRIEHAQDVVSELNKGLLLATTGRKGPVVFDILAKVFKEEVVVTENKIIDAKITNNSGCSMNEIIKQLRQLLQKAKRPIFLIGEGIRQSNTIEEMHNLASKLHIPILSSRCSEDIIADSENYYGYVGSHGVRYSNFILSKADLIISLGNRLSFPIESKSFRQIFDTAKVFRIDIDDAELMRKIPNELKFKINLSTFFDKLNKIKIKYNEYGEWISVCEEIKKCLYKQDVNDPTQIIANIFSKISSDTIITSDVGNNEFWLSRAYVYSKIANRILYSSAYGALGCSIGKAIGAYCFSKKPVICFCGDQGFQLNSQELQYIADNHIPLAIVILNNNSSGMIKSHEKQKYGCNYVHTTIDTGYSVPNFRRIADGYGLSYYKCSNSRCGKIDRYLEKIEQASIIEVVIDENVELNPWLPVGNECQDMKPLLSENLYDKLSEL